MGYFDYNILKEIEELEKEAEMKEFEKKREMAEKSPADHAEETIK